ncbi:MAG: tRNA N6-adenosine threonylcarbamoyltransferase [Dehalococcoidia bacterium]|nr:tRNA N6-adenosine threonylcarbamoyltransferase [Bacillota bacterium]MBT9142902.1 tRNA N6-adenosine threonylcarbamoyltransferase [Bacillota bacterium]
MMFLGVDTSCYTTSLAVIDAKGRLLSEARKLLAVPQGERGLRQSDGVFQHVQNLPELVSVLTKEFSPLKPQAVAASTRPRPLTDSYLPVFTVGASFARSLALVFGVPFFELSHQEGHLLAGLWSAGVAWQSFYVVHLSGGTTEVLAVEMKEELLLSELGGTEDLHAGQFIDRVGVALGLMFPSGPNLERLGACSGPTPLTVPVAVKGGILSFSGPESHVQRALLQGARPEEAARGVEHCVAQSVWLILKNIEREHGVKPVLFVGGVMANAYIRSYLSEKIGSNAAFAGVDFAGDNAVGAALFAHKFTC